MSMSVYAFRSEEGYAKVGVSAKPTERLYWVQQGVPFLLVCLKTWEHEKAILVEIAAHNYLSDFRLKGEWFMASADQVMTAVESAITYVEDGGEAMRRLKPLRSKGQKAARGRMGGRPLTFTDEQIEAAVAEQPTYKAAAKKIGASEITIKRRMAAIKAKREKEIQQ